MKQHRGSMLLSRVNLMRLRQRHKKLMQLRLRLLPYTVLCSMLEFLIEKKIYIIRLKLLLK
jgi:hypothetical protein